MMPRPERRRPVADGPDVAVHQRTLAWLVAVALVSGLCLRAGASTAWANAPWSAAALDKMPCVSLSAEAVGDAAELGVTKEDLLRAAASVSTRLPKLRIRAVCPGADDTLSVAVIARNLSRECGPAYTASIHVAVIRLATARGGQRAFPAPVWFRPQLVWGPPPAARGQVLQAIDALLKEFVEEYRLAGND